MQRCLKVRCKNKTSDEESKQCETQGEKPRAEDAPVESVAIRLPPRRRSTDRSRSVEDDSGGQRERQAATWRGGIEERDKETENGSCRVNVAVCLAPPEERMLHQLQLRPKGLMDKAAQRGSRVRRPLSCQG